MCKQKKKRKLYLCWTELFEIELFICIKMDLALNNQQWLIRHKPKPNQTSFSIVVIFFSFYIFFFFFFFFLLYPLLASERAQLVIRNPLPTKANEKKKQQERTRGEHVITCAEVSTLAWGPRLGPVATICGKQIVTMLSSLSTFLPFGTNIYYVFKFCTFPICDLEVSFLSLAHTPTHFSLKTFRLEKLLLCCRGSCAFPTEK